MDEVASAVTYEGGVYIFMRSGKVFRMHRDPYSGRLLFESIGNVVPH